MKTTDPENWKRLEERIAPHTARPSENREEFDVDRTRILHSAAFRRLQGKTQVLGIGESDFLRTRLTHSIEVANIGRGLLQSLEKIATPEQRHALPDQDLIEAICFAHDLGHPPFGHNGEKALNSKMSEQGGFEGNGHTLRLLTKLESRIEGHGLNLTRRTLLGVLKYPVPYSVLTSSNESAGLLKGGKPPKCYFDSEVDVVDWLLGVFSEDDRKKFRTFSAAVKDSKNPKSERSAKTIHKTLDCSIMDAADEISYGVHDLEDGLQIGMIQERHLTKERDINGKSEALSDLLDTDWGRRWELNGLVTKLCDPSSDAKVRRKTAIGGLVHALIGSVTITEDDSFEHPLLRYRLQLQDTAKRVLEYVNQVAFKEVIGRQSVQTLEYRGRVLVEKIFEALVDQPEKLLPEDYRERYTANEDAACRMRVICDYVAGMTDSYATKFFERLYIPRLGNVFERL